MLAKLLKYEWKATAPLLGTLSLAALGVGVLGGLLLRLSGIDYQSEVVESLFSATTSITLGFLALALVAYVLATTLLLLHRFYQNKFTDQGYLTFTLPVTSHQIFLSSLANLLLWQLICVVVVLVSGLLLTLIGDLMPDNPYALEFFQEMAEDPFGRQNMLLWLSQVLIGWLFYNVIALTCIVLGASIAKKHKLLMAFVMYYIISFVMRFLTGILTVVFALSNLNMGDGIGFLHGTALSVLALEFVLLLCGYFLSIRLMSRRLNLN